MVKYLINLSRFVSYDEKKQIVKELINKGYKVSNDVWSFRRLIVNKPIIQKPYIASIIKLEETFSPKTISETVSKLKNYKIKEIKSKIWTGVPFHAKAIKDRYLKKNKFVDSGDILYLEAKIENNAPTVRIGIYLTRNIEDKNKYPDIAIETPYTIGEISDFVRLSKTFKIKVYIITNKDLSCLSAIRKFLVDNSFDKAKIEIIESIDKIKDKYDLTGFSMWSKKPVKDLILKKNKKQLFLFGNEKRGLLKRTMDLCSQIVKIGNSSEPLRATQAASFVFGYISKD